MIREASSKRGAIIQRTYEADERVCAHAVELLLKKPPTRKRTVSHAPGNGPDDAEESKNDRTTEPEYTR
jgi:hypothetical protein